MALRVDMHTFTIGWLVHQQWLSIGYFIVEHPSTNSFNCCWCVRVATPILRAWCNLCKRCNICKLSCTLGSSSSHCTLLSTSSVHNFCRDFLALIFLLDLVLTDLFFGHPTSEHHPHDAHHCPEHTEPHHQLNHADTFLCFFLLFAFHSLDQSQGCHHLNGILQLCHCTHQTPGLDFLGVTLAELLQGYHVQLITKLLKLCRLQRLRANICQVVICPDCMQGKLPLPQGFLNPQAFHL